MGSLLSHYVKRCWPSWLVLGLGQVGEAGGKKGMKCGMKDKVKPSEG